MDEQIVMPPERATAADNAATRTVFALMGFDVGGNSGDYIVGLYWHDHEAKAAAHALVSQMCGGRDDMQITKWGEDGYAHITQPYSRIGALYVERHEISGQTPAPDAVDPQAPRTSS